MKSYFILFTSLLAFNANTAFAQKKEFCEVGAFTLSEMNNKIPVKFSPNSKSRTIDYIDAIIDDGEIKGADLIISDIKNGYARVFYENQSQRAGNKYGWIETKYLGFRVQSEVVFSYPNIKSFPAYKVEYEAISNRNVKKIHACKNEWLNISFSLDKKKPVNGWIRGICANQETTCDGLIGDSWDKF